MDVLCRSTVGPLEGLGHRLIEKVDELQDTTIQVVQRVKASSFEEPASQYREPDLYLIHPGGVLGSVDEANTMRGIAKKAPAGLHGGKDSSPAFDTQVFFDPALISNPSDQRLGLLGIELIDHKDPAGLRICGHGLTDMVEEILFGSARTDCRGNDFACGYLEVGDQA